MKEILNPVLRLAYDKWSTNCGKGFDTCLFDETDKQYQALPGVGSLRSRWCGEVFIHIEHVIKAHKKAFDCVAITLTQEVRGFQTVKPVILEAIEETDKKTEIYDVNLFGKYVTRMQEKFPDVSLDLRSNDVGTPSQTTHASELGGFARITGTMIGRCGTVCYTNGSKIFVPSDYDKMVYFSKFILGSRIRITFQELFDYWQQCNNLYEKYVIQKQKDLDAFLDI